MRRSTRLVLSLAAFVALAGSAADAVTLNGLGAAGGWDDINKSADVTYLLDVSDYTSDLSSSRTTSALDSAFSTWGSAGATRLNLIKLADDGGNYDVFDGVGGTLDQSGDFRHANIVVGGFLSESYFLSLDAINGSNILAVTWTAQLRGGGSPKPAWDAEVFFNDGYLWTDDAAAANADLAAGLPNLMIDLETVALHEFGHALGFGHENDVSSVMASYYGGTQRSLFADDVLAITSLYNSEGGKTKGGGGGRNNRLVWNDQAGAWGYITSITYVDFDAITIATPEPLSFVLTTFGLGALLLRRFRA